MNKTEINLAYNHDQSATEQNVCWGDRRVSIVLHDFSDEYVPITEYGELYMDDDYGYYYREAAVGSSIYPLTIRFNKDKMKDVVRYVFEGTPEGFGTFLKTLDGYEDGV